MGSYLSDKVAAPVQKTEINDVGIRCADHATPLYQQKFSLTLPTSGARSIVIVRLRTRSHRVLVFFLLNLRHIFLGLPLYDECKVYFWAYSHTMNVR
jgi:hypothetical protein